MQSTLNIRQYLSWFDWFVFSICMLVTILAVIYGQLRKNQKTTDSQSFLDHMLMGRQLTLPLFVGTLVATWYGGIFGVTKIAFNKGIFNFITQGVFWYITYILFAFFLVKKVRQYNSITLPELIGTMFGPKSAKLSAIFNLFNVIPIVYTISLGLFLQMIFGGNLVLMTLFGVLFVMSYSFLGGFRAVVFSDLVQFFIMCISVFFILAFSVSKFGGIFWLKNNLPASYFHPLGDQGLLATCVWGLIALSTLVDPNFYQRCFAAESTKTAKTGILISTFIWFCFDICTTLGAMYARAIIPHADSSSAYLTYGIQVLPTGLRGFLLAGILATILSTMDSYLFIASTTISYDLAPKKWQHKIWLNHLGLVFTGLLSVLLASVFDGNIKIVWKTLGSYSAACLLLPVLYGYAFPGKISDKNFVYASLSGVVATTYWRNVNHFGFWKNVDELYAGIAATLLCLILYQFIHNWCEVKNNR